MWDLVHTNVVLCLVKRVQTLRKIIFALFWNTQSVSSGRYSTILALSKSSLLTSEVGTTIFISVEETLRQ